MGCGCWGCSTRETEKKRKMPKMNGCYVRRKAEIKKRDCSIRTQRGCKVRMDVPATRQDKIGQGKESKARYKGKARQANDEHYKRRKQRKERKKNGG